MQAGPPEPEVAPEDDEYSMSDESIGASNALDMNDLNRVFEVKKVEEFSSDDPHNPRNMQVKKTLDDYTGHRTSHVAYRTASTGRWPSDVSCPERGCGNQSTKGMNHGFGL